jgi:hypothetical protein
VGGSRGGGVEKQVKNVASDCLNIEHHSGNFCKHENFEIWKIQWKNNKNYLQNITTIQDRRVLSIHPSHLKSNEKIASCMYVGGGGVISFSYFIGGSSVLRSSKGGGYEIFVYDKKNLPPHPRV